MKKIMMTILIMVSTIISACGNTAADANAESPSSASILESVEEEQSQEELMLTDLFNKQSAVEELAYDYNGENSYFENSVECIVNSDAQVYEITWKEALELYKSKSDCIILFSAPWCPYCQAQIMPLTNAAVRSNKPIFYVNVQKYPRPEYKLRASDNGENEIYLYQAAYEGYEELVSLLYEDHVDYAISNVVVTSQDGEECQTDIAKIPVPLLLKITENGTVAFDYDEAYESYDGLQEEEISSLENALEEYIKQ